jgi:2-polyprenyl-3-methyl-5-hydroxy-6-metoxy-1,4-benzoquinol methylase
MDYYSKYDAILNHCHGKKVLHLGCVGNNDSATETKVAASPSTLHLKLSAAAQVTGVDISADAVEEYKRIGICDNIVVGDVEKLEALGLHPEFDVIVIGDLIEHLSNPGHMLDGVRKLCRPDTEVILTTPHAFGLAGFLRHAARRFREGQQHVMTFNQQNLSNLVERHGFQVLGVDTCHQPEAARGLLFRAGKALFTLFPHLGGTLFFRLRKSH